MIEWGALALKAAPFAAGQARKWWNRDTGANLSRRIVEEIRADGGRPAGQRQRLVDEWRLVKDDAILARVVASLLLEPEPEVEALVEHRLLELLDDLDLPLGVEATAAYLARTVLGNLGAAQKDAETADRADHRRTHNKLDALSGDVADVDEQVRALRARQDALEEVPERRGAPVALPGPSTLVLPGDLADDEQRVLDWLRRADTGVATQLAALLQAQGPDGLDGLVRVPPAWAAAAPPELWAAVNRLCNMAGRFQLGREAAAVEGEHPAADRAAALTRAARSAFLADDTVIGEADLARASAISADHPAVLLLRAELATTHVERLAIADRIEPRDDAELAGKLGQRAFALAGMGNTTEALAEARASLALDDGGPGLEAKHLAVVMAAARDFPDSPPAAELSEAADWFLELAERHERIGLKSIVVVSRSRGAVALAAGGQSQRARELIDAAVAGGAAPNREAAWNFALGANILGDQALALRALPDDGTEHVRVQRASFAVLGRIGVAEVAADLDELLASDQEDVAAAAAQLRLIVAHDPAVELREDIAALVPDGQQLLAHAKAIRAANEGDLVTAQQIVASLDDPSSLMLRAELAGQAGEHGRAVGLAVRLTTIDGSPLARLALAARRRAAGQLAQARADALLVADNVVNTPALRAEAYRFAAEAASAEGDFTALEQVARAWMGVPDQSDDAAWWTVFALARRRRHREALELADARGLEPRTEQQALILAQAAMYGTDDPVDRVRRMTALSDAQARPERLEYTVIMAGLQLANDVVVDEALDRRIRQTFEDFGERFPDSALIQVIAVDRDDPAGSLFATLERLSRRSETHDAAVDEAQAGVRSGGTPVAVLAALTGESTIAQLVDGGPLPLGVADDAAREEEERAAEQALDEAAASWDATAIAVASGLPDGTGATIRGLLAASHVAQAVFDEVARDDDRPGRCGEAAIRAAALAGELTLSPDVPGGPAVNDPDLAEALADTDAPLAFRGLVGAINVARARGLPLYSDDRAVRVMARGSGVAAFGTVAVLDVLERRGQWPGAQAAGVRAELLAHGAWGVRITPDELVATLRERGLRWDAGAAGFFSDALAHRHPPRGLMEHAAAVLLAVAEEVPEHLSEWAERLVAVSGETLGQQAPWIVRILLGRTIHLGGEPDDDRDRAAARVVRALRTLPVFTGYSTQFDPLMVLVEEWLLAAPTDPARAWIVRSVMRQVDDEDRRRLEQAFVTP